jgi:energy-coupling factor transporter ATP-binding protein EcfA2
MNSAGQPLVSQTSDEFELWLSGRPRWLQTAAQQIMENNRLPSEAETLELANLCKGEASKTKGLTFLRSEHGAFSGNPSAVKLRIDGLADVQGVNAIRNGATLNFGNADITVIYGANGAGKTGFSRILKNACGSRSKGDVHPNVFHSNSPPATACVNISLNGITQQLSWSLAGKPLESLRHVHVFDTQFASMYVGLPNEATYEPFRMRFLSLLVTVCDRVAANLDTQKKALPKVLPTPPSEFSSTPAAKWINGLKASTPTAEVEQQCEYPKSLDDERIASESALGEKDIPTRLKSIAVNHTALSRLKQNLTESRAGLCDDALTELMTARQVAQTRRLIAQEEAQKVFASAPLTGVGEAAWRALWDQARKYSELHAYPGAEFPMITDGSVCVLCQQKIEAVGAQRLSHFETFVKNGLEAEAVAAEQRAQELRERLPALPRIENWIVELSLLKIDEQLARSIFVSLEKRRAAAEAATQMGEVPSFDWTMLEQSAEFRESAVLAEEQSLQDLMKDGHRTQLEKRVIELRSIQWLRQNKQTILDEVSRLASIAVLDKATALTKTNSLTTKKNELAAQELAAGYQIRFAKELGDLGGQRIPVHLVAKQEGKGKITFMLGLKDAKQSVQTQFVLSEGETRVVALAAFLADITAVEQSAPFIFDDPISSLDQDFEERVVQRLVELSKTRQVIIFTHRLSLLTLIESVVERLEKQAKLQKTQSPVGLHVESLHRLGQIAGIVQPLSLRDSAPKKALNRLVSEFIAKLKKHHSQGEIAEYTVLAQTICTQFRIIVEQCVEKILCNDVLRRFRRSVETKGKIGAMAKIESADCLLIDDLMTRYSVFEHSQPEELPASLPELQVLESDIHKLNDWLIEFEQRAVP